MPNKEFARLFANERMLERVRPTDGPALDGRQVVQVSDARSALDRLSEAEEEEEEEAHQRHLS